MKQRAPTSNKVSRFYGPLIMSCKLTPLMSASMIYALTENYQELRPLAPVDEARP